MHIIELFSCPHYARRHNNSFDFYNNSPFSIILYLLFTVFTLFDFSIILIQMNTRQTSNKLFFCQFHINKSPKADDSGIRKFYLPPNRGDIPALTSGEFSFITASASIGLHVGEIARPKCESRQNNWQSIKPIWKTDTNELHR